MKKNRSTHAATIHLFLSTLTSFFIWFHLTLTGKVQKSQRDVNMNFENFEKGKARNHVIAYSYNPSIVS